MPPPLQKNRCKKTTDRKYAVALSWKTELPLLVWLWILCISFTLTINKDRFLCIWGKGARTLHLEYSFFLKLIKVLRSQTFSFSWNKDCNTKKVSLALQGFSWSLRKLILIAPEGRGGDSSITAGKCCKELHIIRTVLITSGFLP